MTLELVRPSLKYLPGCKDALERGWSPTIDYPDKKRAELLVKIEVEPDRYVQDLNDRDAKSGVYTMPDGTTVPLLPGYTL